jgi:hypothetical protein
VELQPHGTVFPQGRQPILVLNAGDGATAGARIVYVDEGGSIAETLPTSVGNGSLRAALPHFSKYYAVGE